MISDFAEDYEEAEHFHIYTAYPDRNEFDHKSTQIQHYPAIRFYPSVKEGKKTKWVNYKGTVTPLVLILLNNDFQGIEKFIRKHATVELPEPEEDDEL